ncbi:MAG: hypothetical protein ABFS28_08540 [Bacteroidota bacterium]
MDKKKSGSFWAELKRRHVIRTVAIYAPAAFIILELIDIITPALSLPPWTITLTVIILASGFPVIIVLSWIFDLTPEGLQKTDPAASSFDENPPERSDRRKLKVSDGIIAVLIAVVCILAYPKILNPDKLKEVRDQDGKISLAVLPFKNMTSDTLLNVWQNGLQNLLITGLSNSAELSVRQYQSTSSVINSRGENFTALTPLQARDIAGKLETRTLIRGNFLKAGKEVRMDAQLVDAETSEIFQTFQVSGATESDFITMADSLTVLLKNYVEIKNIQERTNSSIIQAETYTGSSEAFKYYMYALDAVFQMEWEQGIEWFTKVIEKDSTFINAQIYMAYAYHSMNNDRLAKLLVTKIYEKKDRVSVTDRLMLQHLHAYFFASPYEEIKYLRQLMEIDDLNPIYYHMLAFAHYKVHEYEEAVHIWEQVFTLHDKWGTNFENPFSYFLMGDAYHQLGESKKEGDILELGSAVFPENGYILHYRAIWALSQEKTDLADEIMEEYLSFRHNVTHCPEALITNDIGDIYAKADHLLEAEKQFREATSLAPQAGQFRFNLAKFLIDNEVNVPEGIEIVDGFLERLPDHWNLLNYKGWGLYKLGEIDEAVKVLKLAWEKKPIYNHELYLRLQEAENALAGMG